MVRRRRVVEEGEAGPPPQRPPYGEPWVWLLLLLVLVLGGLGALWWWQTEGEDDSATTTVVETATVETETETVETVTETETEPAETETVEEEETGPAEVPDVVGQGHVEAGEQIEAQGLKADTYPVPSAEPRGTVVEQNPSGGTTAESGSTVRLNVSLGEGDREAREVPDVTGPKESNARAAARAGGFTVRTVDRDAPSPEEVGEVILQEPDAGSSAPELTQITLYVGR